MRRILVVDDESDVLHLLHMLLSQAGFEVELAADGDEALRRIAACAPDLVLCDVAMPVRDGYETLTAMRCQAATRHLPFLMLSAKCRDVDAAKALAAGADGYVTKPFRRVQLLLEIERCLAERSASSCPD